MKKILFLIVALNTGIHAMYLSEEDMAKKKYKEGVGSLSEYQKSRDRMLIEKMGVYGFQHLNELTEAQKDERFQGQFDSRWYIAYERIQCLKTGTATVFSWLGTGLLAYFFCVEKTDTWGNEQCTPEPKKTLAVAACAVCGVALFCVGCFSSLLLCDACKGLRYGKRCQKEYEQVLQLQMGAKKSE